MASEEKAYFLKLSTAPVEPENAAQRAPGVIEDFLDQLDENQQAEVLGALLSGTALVEKHGESIGRELADLRLERLRGGITEAAAKLFLPRRRVSR